MFVGILMVKVCMFVGEGIWLDPENWSVGNYIGEITACVTSREILEGSVSERMVDALVG